nr:hypothetical protein [Tanacetum cinerariifolium]
MINLRNTRKTWLKHARKIKKSHESPKTSPGSPPHQPPPPPPPAGPSGGLGASGSSQVPPPPPPLSSTNQENTMADINAPAGQAPAMAPPVRTDDQIFHASDGCQLDEQWFVLTKDTLREALHIIPVNSNQAFVPPPSSDALINFVNELGYPKLVRNLSNVVTNNMFQPWRALTTIINLCLTRKTSGFERLRAHVL